jgi:hypothetical protein
MMMMVMPSVPEIRRITSHHHDNNIRKWTHRFNEQGIVGGIISTKHIRNAHKFTDNVESKIVEISSKNSTKILWIAFSIWSLRVLAGFIIIMNDIKLVGITSHIETRNILLKQNQMETFQDYIIR